jgi:hypothetical protein
MGGWRFDSFILVIPRDSVGFSVRHSVFRQKREGRERKGTERTGTIATMVLHKKSGTASSNLGFKGSARRDTVHREMHPLARRGNPTRIHEQL